jgi:hypothetical protein
MRSTTDWFAVDGKSLVRARFNSELPTTDRGYLLIRDSAR